MAPARTRLLKTFELKESGCVHVALEYMVPGLGTTALDFLRANPDIRFMTLKQPRTMVVWLTSSGVSKKFRKICWFGA